MRVAWCPTAMHTAGMKTEGVRRLKAARPPVDISRASLSPPGAARGDGRPDARNGVDPLRADRPANRGRPARGEEFGADHREGETSNGARDVARR